MKKIILWLCKVFKVDLVEPIKQETYVNYVHEKVPYTQITTSANINLSQSFPPNDIPLIIEDYKVSMVREITKKLVEEDILKWDEYEDVFTHTYKIRCSFYAAKKPE